MAHVSASLSGAIRNFAFWLANGTVGKPLLDGIDYSCIFSEPSALETTFAIYVNVIEVDDNGHVVNAREAEQRAAQYIRSYVDDSYSADPEFDDWEVRLH